MSKKLLVVDDALIIREMVKDTAEKAGWTIAGEANNGEDAIQQYRKLKPDAVTLDMVMPEFDGLHALQGILEHDPSARVLVVSALDQQEILKRAIEIGAADFVVKPFEESNLIDALEGLCALQ